MIGARIVFRGWRAGIVERFEPLSVGMCDTLIAFDDGVQIWVASHELRRADGVPVPDRSDLRRRADAEALTQLRAIRAGHVRDWNRPWPGCEFAKALVGQAIDGAITEIERRLA